MRGQISKPDRWFFATFDSKKNPRLTKGERADLYRIWWKHKDVRLGKVTP